MALRVVVALDHRFHRTPDGKIWTGTVFTYSFWTRYLDVFSQVQVVARVQEVLSASTGWKRADGDRVSFAPVPFYLGPTQYLLRSWKVNRAARGAVMPNDAVILRIGSTIAGCIQSRLRKTGHPYGVEVVGDPYDVFSPGAIKHPLRPFLRWYSPRQMRRFCTEACAASYVTEFSLQRRYPPSFGAFSTHYSSIELDDQAFVPLPRSVCPGKSKFSLITVGSLEHLYKAQDILIDAVALGVQEGLDLELVLVGDGKHRQELESRVKRLQLGERVQFLGHLQAGAAIRAQLDRSDLFVLPSRQEGLPRAMLEAMARALPCIGSTVGGIPELLPADDLVSPGEVTGLARKIREVVLSAERLSKMSFYNLDKAREYHNEILKQRRIAFYQHVKEKTEAWVRTQTR